MRTRSGFTLIETLIALIVFMVSLNLGLMAIRILKGLPDLSVQRQNRTGLLQLRQILSLGHDFIITEASVCMDFGTEETCFEQDGDRLIQHPGTQIYLIGLDELSFIKEGNILSITMRQREAEETYPLIEVIN